MGAPHNKNRYGELWPAYKIKVGLEILTALKPYVVVSGGWAWHFMSPKDHIEYKHAHDHKDIDVFVDPKNVSYVMQILQGHGFGKVWTRYDRFSSDENFRRYERQIESPEERIFRVTIDFFEKKDVPSREIDGWTVVAPKFLLSLYNSIHSSHSCWAVQAATRLLDRGIDPLYREELIAIPRQ